MPTLPSETPTPTATQQTRGSVWLAARASLAARRSAPFAKVWSITFGGLTLLALLVPLLGRDPAAADRAANGQLAADTLRSAQIVRDAASAVAVAESLHLAARTQLTAWRAASASVGRATALAAPIRAMSRAASPALAELSARIERAKRERTIVAWIEVSEDPSVNRGPRVRGLADSLRSFDARMRALTTGGGSAVQRDELLRRAGAAGRTIVAIAENRREELVATAVDSVSVTTTVATSVVPSEPSSVPVAGSLLTESAPDTTASRAALRGAQESLTDARRAHDSLTAALVAQSVANVPRDRGPTLARTSLAIATASLLLLGLLARFATAMSREMNAPTLADAGEAERLARAPVLTTVREAMLDGPARFHPSGIDPFRILYLGLTATGTRVRTAIVTGADPVIVAATGARLAIAAAADHRQTLVVDLDAANIPLSLTFRERAEPGMSDALARAFTWREVARPVGSSDGLTITLLPAGTERDDLATGAELTELLESFVRLRSGYELTIIVTPPGRIALAAQLVEGGPVILTVAAGETALTDLEREVVEVRAANHRLQGMVLWDAPRPTLPSRAELAALLSKRKGRTPGGSFEAVQRVISQKSSGSKRP